MNVSLLRVLVCPSCHGSLQVSPADVTEIVEGQLRCLACAREYSITNGIPRFVEHDNYASSFGYQWNSFRREQIDSFNGTTLSADRLWTETGWSRTELDGRWVLDAGCGAGRFLDAAAVTGGQVVGVDISNAVDAARENLRGRENVHLVQASIYDLPFRAGTFDFCYCIGVVQHTPNPERSLRAIAAVVKTGGRLAVTIYERRRWYTRLFAKYWLRRVSTLMRKESLLKLVERTMPVAFPVTDVLFRIPLLGRLFMFVIPVANYVHEKQLSREQRYAWAILDTFDMLSPQYDQPMTEEEATSALATAGVPSVRQSYAGLNLVGQKQGT